MATVVQHPLKDVVSKCVGFEPVQQCHLETSIPSGTITRCFQMVIFYIPHAHNLYKTCNQQAPMQLEAHILVMAAFAVMQRKQRY